MIDQSITFMDVVVLWAVQLCIISTPWKRPAGLTHPGIEALIDKGPLKHTYVGYLKFNILTKVLDEPSL